MNKLNICNLRLADFSYNFNKTRQRLSDVILQKGDGVAVIPTLAKKITSELAEVRQLPQQAQTIESISGHTYIRKRISLTLLVKRLILWSEGLSQGLLGGPALFKYNASHLFQQN